MLEGELGARIPGVTVEDVRVSDVTDIEAPVLVEVDASWAGWDPVDGARATLHPLGADVRLTRAYAGSSEREQVLVLPHRFTVTEDHEYLLPAGWQAERTLEDASGAGPFGSWTIVRELEGDRMRTRAEVVIDVERVAVEDYAAFRAFLSDAEEALNQRVVFEIGGAS